MVLFTRVIREGLLEKVERRPKSGEGAKNAPDRGTGRCKGPGARMGVSRKARNYWGPGRAGSE